MDLRSNYQGVYLNNRRLSISDKMPPTFSATPFIIYRQNALPHLFGAEEKKTRISASI